MALSTEITAQLKQYLAKLNSNVVIEAFVDESEVSTNMSELLVELAEMTEKITLKFIKIRLRERHPLELTNLMKQLVFNLQEFLWDTNFHH